jgi:large subunit ribosomal protein L35
MPKMKTKRGAAKRFRLSARGKIKRSRAYKRHILTSKTTKRKRHLDMEALVSKADARRVREMLPYGRP